MRNQWLSTFTIILLFILTLIVSHHITSGEQIVDSTGIKAPTASHVGQTFVLQVATNGNLELISLAPAMSKVFEGWKQKTLEGK